MEGKPIIIIALLVAIGGGVAVVGGDLFPGGSDEPAAPFPTETPTATPSAETGGAGGSTATATATPRPPFGFVIENVESCGTTCRNVTSTLVNQQDKTAEDITVHTRIFAGRGTDGDEIWRGQEGVGTLGAGESYTTTRQVELSYSEALAVQNNDGWITIQTTVETADQTVTFSDERQVT